MHHKYYSIRSFHNLRTFVVFFTRPSGVSFSQSKFLHTNVHKETHFRQHSSVRCHHWNSRCKGRKLVHSILSHDIPSVFPSVRYVTREKILLNHCSWVSVHIRHHFHRKRRTLTSSTIPPFHVFLLPLEFSVPPLSTPFQWHVTLAVLLHCHPINMFCLDSEQNNNCDVVLFFDLMDIFLTPAVTSSSV